MAIYAIGDLHLSLSGEKPMEIFGSKWENHAEKLREGFSCVKDTDTTVLCGDLSWGMNFAESVEDFRFVHSLPGKKILIKGNHDYWWSTMSKMRQFLKENGFDSIEIMNNNSFTVDGISLCGTRGWFYEEETGGEHDKKILSREVGRLKASLDAAETGKKAVFLHYPPVFCNYHCDEILAVLKEYEVRHCYYGHIHGKGIPAAFNGWRDGTEFRLVSADAVNFTPQLVRL